MGDIIHAIRAKPARDGRAIVGRVPGKGLADEF